VHKTKECLHSTMESLSDARSTMTAHSIIKVCTIPSRLPRSNSQKFISEILKEVSEDGWIVPGALPSEALELIAMNEMFQKIMRPDTLSPFQHSTIRDQGMQVLHGDEAVALMKKGCGSIAERVDEIHSWVQGTKFGDVLGDMENVKLLRISGFEVVAILRTISELDGAWTWEDLNLRIDLRRSE
jgi:hypothetical protein